MLLISPGDVHGAGTTPDLLLYHAPRSRKVSAARTAHTSGSFGSSSGSPRAGAGNISPLPPHARSWPPLGAAASVGTAFFGVSCPKAACPYTLPSPGEAKPTENFPTGRRRDASSSGDAGVGRAPLQPGTCKSPDFFSPETREKKNTTPAVNGNANLVLFQLAPTASCSAFLELRGGTGHDRSPPTGCQAICGAVNRLERGKNPEAFPPEASSTVTPPQTHEIAV